MIFLRPCREYAGLLRVADGLTFELHRIDYDRTGRYNPLTNSEFPFCIRLFNYRHNDFTAAMTWHEHLELWIPLDSEVSFRMGESRVDLDAGDILVVDNLKLHTVLDRPGLDARVISIGFLPEFVYSLGSPSYDYYSLLPFFTQQTGSPHLVPGNAPLYPTMVSTVADLLECYFGRELYFEVGCKANLLRLLYALARHFWVSESLRSVMIRQQEAAGKIETGVRIHFDPLRGKHRRRKGRAPCASERVAVQPGLQTDFGNDFCELCHPCPPLARTPHATGESGHHRRDCSGGRILGSELF